MNELSQRIICSENYELNYYPNITFIIPAYNEEKRISYVIVVVYLILLAIRHKKVPTYYYAIIITLIAIPFIVAINILSKGY